MVSTIEVLRAARRAGRSGDVVQSCSLYARVLSEDPQHAEALHFYGLLQDDTLGSLESLAWVERSLRLSEGNAVFLTNKALALQKRHAIEDSIESLRCALAAQADYAQAFLALGHARKELK
jgi:tetratricopeptide (TPR) repeat protein